MKYIWCLLIILVSFSWCQENQEHFSILENYRKVITPISTSVCILSIAICTLITSNSVLVNMKFHALLYAHTQA